MWLSCSDTEVISCSPGLSVKSEVGLRQCSFLGIVLRSDRFTWYWIQLPVIDVVITTLSSLYGLLNKVEKHKYFTNKPWLSKLSNCMGWLGWESGTYLNPIDFNINMCKWDPLITSVFRLTSFPPSTNCYGDILRRHLACFIIHLISETLVCIDVDQVKLSCTVVVLWHLCIEKI